jgi:hypothetical protein
MWLSDDVVTDVRARVTCALTQEADMWLGDAETQDANISHVVGRCSDARCQDVVEEVVVDATGRHVVEEVPAGSGRKRSAIG